MVQTVFWSWQSDQPSRETRNIIRDALVSALDRIAIEMEEAERPEIDHDTKDAPGSPDIVATILAKIQQAAVFVADVTPIAVSDGGKQVANRTQKVMLRLNVQLVVKRHFWINIIRCNHLAACSFVAHA